MALTLIFALLGSLILALTLTPVLCAMILKNNHGQPKRRTPVAMFIALFNRFLVWGNNCSIWVSLLLNVVFVIQAPF